MRGDARRRYERDMGAAYALEFLSYHIEASYLRSADAAFVYDLAAHYISQASDATRSMPSEPQDERPAGEAFIRATSALGGACIGCDLQCLRRWQDGSA
jgi:hypothetical protein